MRLALIVVVLAAAYSALLVSLDAAAPPQTARPCDGLWVEQNGQPRTCVPSADLTVPRDMPAHIMTLPITGRKQ